MAAPSPSFRIVTIPQSRLTGPPDGAKRGGRAYNPSLASHNGQLLMAYRLSNMTRCDQRTIDFVQYYSSALPPLWNELGVTSLDDSLQSIDPTLIDVAEPTECHWSTGYEDPRIFVHDGRVLTLASHRNERWVFGLSLLALDSNYAVASVVPVRPDVGADLHQKNWNPFSVGPRLYCVASIAPHRVYEIDPDSGSARLAFETKAHAFDDLTFSHEMRGGAGYVRTGNTFVGIARAVLRQHPDENTNDYQCVAYSFDAAPPFAITGRSQPFRIGDTPDALQSIQMVTGIAVKGDNVVIGYGENDCDCRLAVIDRKLLLESIEPL